MNTTIADAIVSAAKTPKSATALALSVGKSKGYMIEEELQTLVRDGRLEEDNSGRFTLYKATNSVATTSSDSNSTTNTLVVDSQNPVKEDVPAGYTVSKLVTRKSDKAKGHIVTLPNNRGKVFVESGYSIVVINGDPIKCVMTPSSAIKIINDYAEDHGMTPYIVRQTSTGTVGKVEDIKSFSGIIDLVIERNNKAA